MENTLALAKNIEQYMLSIKVDEQDFFKTGDLTSGGEFSFWREIDDCIKKFDQDEINLHPCKQEIPSQTHDHSMTDCRRHKLLTPPYAKNAFNHRYGHSRH